MCSLGIEPTTFALLTTEPQEHNIYYIYLYQSQTQAKQSDDNLKTKIDYISEEKVSWEADVQQRT